MRSWNIKIGLYQVRHLLFNSNYKKMKYKNFGKYISTFQALDLIFVSYAFHQRLIHNSRESVEKYVNV